MGEKVQLTSDEKLYGIRELFLKSRTFDGGIEKWTLYHAYMFKEEAVEEAKHLRKIQFASYRARVISGPMGRCAVYYIKE